MTAGDSNVPRLACQGSISVDGYTADVTMGLDVAGMHPAGDGGLVAHPPSVGMRGVPSK